MFLLEKFLFPVSGQAENAVLDNQLHFSLYGVT
jgi:hypothetical protein